jgi:glucose/arabinose dehydrogenase
MITQTRYLFLPILLILSAALSAQPKIQLQDFAAGFVRPVDIAHCGDNRLFIVEQRGLIWIVDSLGNKSPEPFLDIDARVRSVQNEQGLLGLAFDPNYETNGFFYVYYTREPDFDTQVARFSRDANNPNKANPASELVLLNEDQPFTNHNGGCMKFGPDGYLYIALGDGGSANDPQNNGQKKTTFLGKILRINVNAPGQTYAIPADNPFVNDPAYRPEIWSLGWRNPWRFSFDRLTGDIWVADVGQNAREEICFEPAGTGGRNYGWRCYEGFNNFNTSGCQPPAAFTRPVFDYPNPSLGCSVTGGFVYRGQQFPDLYGHYLFTDYCSGRWWATRRLNDTTFNTQLLADFSDNQYSTLGEDSKGELYVASLSAGKIQRIRELCSGFQLSADIAPATCNGSLDGIIDLHIAGGTGNVSLAWSPNANGQSDSLIVYLNPGAYSVTATNGNGCTRTASFTVTAANALPTPVLNFAPGDTLPPLCAGDSLLLATAPPPDDLAVAWYRNGEKIPGATGATLAVTQPGAYYAVYTFALCASDPSPAIQVEVLNAIAPPEIALVAGQAILCPGATATLRATAAPAGYSYQWYRDGLPLSGANNQEYLVSSDTIGFFSVALEGPCGNVVSTDFLVDAEVIAPFEISQNADTLSVGSWSSYQWFLNGLPIPGATGPTYVAEESGLYECQVQSNNGCFYSVKLPVIVSQTNLPASVRAFNLAPNPTGGLFVLRMELQQNADLLLSLTDGAQREIFRQNLQGRQIEKAIDLRGLPAGIYLLRVQIGSEVFTRKVIKR